MVEVAEYKAKLRKLRQQLEDAKAESAAKALAPVFDAFLFFY